ncbi:HNH endonuclease signature motif containing protein [Auritidibacter sp. NML100628]|uniref:HNH endonuclease signature motif containing protein n=1 Tax=Auritidibacter sp. NML100628 TaxID=2170742 RepID=UPI000D72712D|nr:HNH endonuclease signature motif containing protein [Auritidibacter sp. NML100628]PXA75443.1 hypothetical protein DCC24_11015 [Auritidibacter sp. NML100628]
MPTPDLSFVDLDQLRAATFGQKAELVKLVMTELATDFQAPDAYEQLARWREDHGYAEWNSHLAAEKTPTTLIPPANMHDSLPTLHHTTQQVARSLDHVHALLTGFTTRATATAEEQQAVLGIPRTARGFKNEKKYLTDRTGVGSADAQQHIERSKYLSPPAPPISGGPAPKVEFPALGDAFRSGKLPTASMDRLIRLIKEIRRYGAQTSTPTTLVEKVLEEAIPILTDQASQMSVNDFAKTCKDWKPKLCFFLDQDGPAPEEVLEPQRGTDQFWVKPRHDGGVDFGGTAYGHYAELLATIDHAANNFAVMKTKVGTTGTEAPENPILTALKANFPELDPSTIVSIDEQHRERLYSEQALFDTRARAQRSFDALFGVLLAGIALGKNKTGLPHTRGQATKVHITMDYETFSHQLAHRYQLDDDQRRSSLDAFYTTHRGTPTTPKGHKFRSEGQFIGTVHPQRLRAAVCDAGIIPHVLGAENEVLDLGREKREFSGAQHRALIARDQGCAAPGCTMPAAWCQIHHIVEWENGGQTDINNAVLLCSAHHVDVHTKKWTIDRIDEYGVWFVPAPWLDPDPSPRRNAYRKH